MSGSATAVCPGACGQLNVTTGWCTGASGKPIAQTSVTTADASRSVGRRRGRGGPDGGSSVASSGARGSAEVLTPGVRLGGQRREAREAAARDVVDPQVVAVGGVVVDDPVDVAPRQGGNPAVREGRERADRGPG